MRRYYDSVEIAELLSKMVTSELSESEKIKLASLITTNNLNNKQDLKNIVDQAIPSQFELTDITARERILVSLKEKILLKERNYKRKVLRYAAAAAIIVFIAAGTYFRNQIKVVHQEPTIEHIADQKTILEYPSGHEVIIPKETNVLALLETEDTIKNTIKEPEFFTVKVPLGLSHKLTLEDGTKVVLYPGSKLNFPSYFKKSERKVSLEGEGYFIVKRDENRPFHVQTKETNIKVLGTSFNVRAYNDESIIETALVSGSVNVNDTKLVPNQMAVYNLNNQSFSIQSINANIYRERANGMFVFDNEPLDEIMNDLSKWFDFDYNYTDESMKAKRFRLKLSREEDFKKILEMMHFTKEVQFKISDKHVEILPKE